MTTEAFEPQDQQEPARRSGGARWVLLLLGLALLGGVGWYVRGRMRPAATGPAPAASADRVVPVQTAPVVQRDVPVYLEGLGNVIPIASVQVRTQVDGRLDSVAFKEGQKVKRGDLLAQVDPRPFLIQLHNAQAALTKDSAQLRNGQLNLERYKTLRQQNLIPQQQVDDQQTLADQYVGAVAADQAAVESAKLNLDYARIVSPIDGVVGVRQVDPGNLVHASDATGIVVVTQLDPIAVLFTLPQDDLAAVSTEMAKGPLVVDAMSREGDKKLSSGKLTVIDNQINTTTATIRLKATFDNPDRVLWPNAFVKARITLSTRKGAIVVPAPAVQKGPQGMFAYVAAADKTAQMRPIEVDITVGDFTIVTKGLQPGEQVVTDGQAQLRPGAKIAPRSDAAPPKDPKEPKEGKDLKDPKDPKEAKSPKDAKDAQ
jgi:membrane fusion protein, multidrug efflux system